MIDEREVREMLKRRAGAIQATPSDPAGVTRRARRRIVRTGIASVVVTAALSLAAFGGVRALQRPPTPANLPTPTPTATAHSSWPDPDAAVLVDIRSGDATPLPSDITSLYASDFSVSRSGERVAFVGGTAGDVYVANIDGTGVRQLTHRGNATDPDWSPDGTQIAYASGGRVHVVDLASGTTTALTRDVGDVWGPTFTPDGRAVIFTADTSDTGWRWLTLRRVAVSGGPVSLFMGHAALATFSPDGTQLAFVEIALPGDGHLWLNDGVRVANTDGTERLRLPAGVGEGGGEVASAWPSWDHDAVWRPTWSPDGTRIAWVDDSKVKIVDVHTGEVTTVASGIHPSWIDEQTLIVE